LSSAARRQSQNTQECEKCEQSDWDFDEKTAFGGKSLDSSAPKREIPGYAGDLWGSRD
jgi:hypothetical protein